MNDHILHRGRKYFCRYCFQASSAEEIFEHHIKDCFEINGKQRMKMLKKMNMLNSKRIEREFERETKSPFMIYTDFQSIAGPEYSEKQTPDESYTNKCQKHVACHYG